MTPLSEQRVWIVGASEGLGRALAQALDAGGARLILSARSADRLENLAAGLRDATALPCDVSDVASVDAAAERAALPDHVIYNAGTYEPMSAATWNTADALRMVDINLMGAMRVIGAVLPGMIARGSGEITLVGSLSAYRGLPAAVGYGAGKAGLLSLAETLRHDLAGTGVRVRIVNPGFIRTRLTDKNAFRMPMLMTPEVAAGHVMRALRSRRFRTDFPAPFSWLLRGLRHLPDWLYFLNTAPERRGNR